MKSTILKPGYFPFTFMAPSLVGAVSLCFDAIVVYQPAYAKPPQMLQHWIDAGFLDIHSPLENLVDEKRLQASLRDFQGWGHTLRHADLAYLKRLGRELAPAHPQIAETASEIRGAAPKGPVGPDDSALALQLFLHLAQEFDRHSWELKEELKRVDTAYWALQSSFRQDQNGDTFAPTAKETVHGTEEDPGGLMTEERMTAWNRLFQKDPAGPLVLFTDSPLALAYLLEEVEEKVLAFYFDMTYAQADRVSTPILRATWADQLQEILNTVLTMPWSPALEQEVVQAGREMAQMINHRIDKALPSHDRRFSSRWYVVPNQDPHALLNRRCGTQGKYQQDHVPEIKNAVIGIIKEHRLTGF
jgi:hypothetical protein